jgi:hypothetical protein
MGMSLKNIVQAIEHEVEKRRFGIRFAAPFFFFAVALFRCYLESHVFAPRSYFSYYVALHHVLWFFTVILFIILTTHLILKVAVEKLLWLMYGASLLMIPVIVVMIQGKPMMADYLMGSFSEIVMHILTIYFTYKKNLPLTAEVIVIFFGMTFVGYLYTKSILRGLALGSAIYLGGNLLAISWIGTFPNTTSIFIVHSALMNHSFMAVICAHSMTFFTLLTVSRADLIKISFRCRFLAAAIALVAGSVYMAIVSQSGWFVHPVDIFLTALPVWTTVFLATLYCCRHQFTLSRWFWIIGLTVLFFQLAVMVPIYFHIGVIKPLTDQEFWLLPLKTI